MRAILQKRPLRFIFAANMISMLGSGMNSAAVAWYILQATHSEMALGTLTVLQTAPAALMLPFTGVLIDREDRRRLVMMLDIIRGVVIVIVAVLAFQHRAKIWELYLMNTLVAAGFWMFWPTITALIQELTPGEEFVHANTFLLAGVQGGWLIAGAIVGFVYNHIGLGGVLLIDCSSYLVSFLCYLAVRKGKHVVPRPAEIHADILAAESALERFWREMREGFEFLRNRPSMIFTGISWALFLGAMLTGIVVTPALSDHVFHAGAVGYGWLNAGWACGSIFGALGAAWIIAKVGTKRATAISLGVLAIAVAIAPLSPLLALAVGVYVVMGLGRGSTGVAINTAAMEQVPPHFMGRVQNMFYFAGTLLQIVLGFSVGAVSQYNLVAGFAIISLVYALAFLSSSWPVSVTSPDERTTAVA